MRKSEELGLMLTRNQQQFENNSRQLKDYLQKKLDLERQVVATTELAGQADKDLLVAQAVNISITVVVLSFIRTVLSWILTEFSSLFLQDRVDFQLLSLTQTKRNRRSLSLGESVKIHLRKGLLHGF